MNDLGAPLGTSIRIFLADGISDGVWVVEKSNWTGKALMAPRTRYKDLRARSDLDGPGVYLLAGPTESGVPAVRIYIGETDDLAGRLDSHNKTKDFWSRVIVSRARTTISTRPTFDTSTEASSMGELSTTAPARPGPLRAVALPCSRGGARIDVRLLARAPRAR